MPNATESQIKNKITEFVQELDLLVRKNTLQALQDVLASDSAPARRGRPPGSKRGPGHPADAASTDDLPAKITAQVKSSPGQSVGEIVSAVGAKAALVKKTIKAMLDAGEIRKAGQKRGTRYYPSGPGRLPGAVAKPGKKKAKARKAKRRAAPKKKARKAPARRVKKAPILKRKRAAASKKAVIVPASKKSAPKAPEGTMVSAHLDTPALARVG